MYSLMKYIYFDISENIFDIQCFFFKMNSMKNNLISIYSIKINIDIYWIIFYKYIFEI